MFAAAEGKSTLGIPKTVGQDFTKPVIGHPGAITALPAIAGKSAPRRKSPRQASMHPESHLPKMHSPKDN